MISEKDIHVYMIISQCYFCIEQRFKLQTQDEGRT